MPVTSGPEKSRGLSRAGRAAALDVRKLLGFGISSAMARQGILLDTVVGICLAVIVIIFLGQGYQGTTLIAALPYCIALLGVVVQVGIGGQLSLAFPAFMAVGAFGSGVLSTTYGWPMAGSGVAAVVFAGVLAYLLGRPITRARGMALALVTVFLLFIVQQILDAGQIFGGTYGLTGVPSLSAGRVSAQSDMAKEIVLAAAVVLVYVISRIITTGAVGQELWLLGYDESSAFALGVDVARRKRQLFVFSSLCAGLSGVLLVHTQSYVSPDQFAPSVSLVMFVMLFFGGRRSLLGAAFGALFFEFLPTWVVSLQNYLLFIEGGVFLIVVLLARDGLAGGLAKLWYYSARAVRITEDRPQASQYNAAQSLRSPAASGSSSAAPSMSELLRGSRRMAEFTGAAVGGRNNGFGLPGRSTAKPGDATALRLGKRTNGFNAQPPASDPPAITVHELSMDFGGMQVLHQLSFDIRGTGTCAIVGPNGAGKTTLFNVISGEIRPSHGSVSINGRALGKVGVMERRGLGVVRTFQKVRLVPHLSTLDNVALGRIIDENKSPLVRWGSRRQLQQARENALATLESLSCAYLAGRPAGDITLAEQRLVELARAVCGRGTIFLLDEPASGLSDQQRDLLAGAVQAIATSATVVLVEHDLRFVRRVAQRVIALERGSIIFDGTPTDMGRDPKVVEAYLGSEAV